MKVYTALLLAATSLAAAAPNQVVLDTIEAGRAIANSALVDFERLSEGAIDSIVDQFEKQKNRVVKGLEASTLGFDVVKVAHLPDYQLRLKEPNLCDPSVQQYSGYLDVSDSRHLFFWFFASRSTGPAPLVVWLNGGPGCSSQTGNLFELGPCSLRDEGKTTEYNPHSWNNQANMIFLDQPINVGYSYSDNESINNTPDAAKDFYAFMQLFYAKFPHFLKTPFHISGESYAGTYIPNFASYINEQNKKAKALVSSPNVHIPLESLLIGNGLTEPYTQFATVPDFSCEPSETAIFSEATCISIRSKVPTCQRLQSYCYNNPTRFTCVPAALYCWSNIVGPIQQLPINPYDVRKSCNRNGEDGPLCYKEMSWIETYLNTPEIRKELGAPEGLNFESCNMKVNQAFMFTGDGMHNSAALIPELLQDGIRVLIYAGAYDFMFGNKEWVLALDSPFKKQLAAAEDVVYRTLTTGKKAGEVRQAGPGAGNFTYIKIYNAGHMVPFDQPDVASDMVNRWLENIPF